MFFYEILCGPQSVDAMDVCVDWWACKQPPSSCIRLQSHPQADHVRTHVPGNADASYRPGWAMRWRSESACGVNVARQRMRDSLYEYIHPVLQVILIFI